MPVRLPNPDEDFIGQYNRLSASQVNTWKACPRLWYYEKVRRFVMPQIPILFVGRAVEEAICKTLKEAPTLIVATAPEDIYAPTPLDEDGRPDRNYDGKWPAEQLLLLPASKWPTDKATLLAWAEKRVLMHLAASLEAMRVEWSKHDRRAGNWEDDVDIKRCAQMATNGIKMHMQEVEACYNTIDDDELEQWRSGHRHHWPAPDGRGYTLEAHPLAQSGEIKWIEAWEIARPWFVDPDAKPFMMNAVHPEHWFQGEYDLVYRWGNQIKIVDIKASLGNSDRSGDYVEQMRMYAYLWWSTHDKQPVDDLEIWYLAADAKKQIDVPNEEENSTISAMNYEHYGLNCGKKRHPLSNALQNLLLCVRLDQEAFHQTKNLKKHDANVVIGPIFVQMANGLEINRVEEYSIYLVSQPKRKQSHSTNLKPATRLQVEFMP